MEKMLEKEMFTLMEKDEYVNLVCDQLEILPPEMVVHRLTGDGKRDEMVGPMWSLRSEEHTSELQSHVRSSYAVFCLKKKKQIK